MHNSVNNCKIHHYTDNTNLLLTNSSIKKINRQVNHDLSFICHWLRVNKSKYQQNRNHNFSAKDEANNKASRFQNLKSKNQHLQ